MSSKHRKQEIEHMTSEALRNQPDALADIGRGERYLSQDYQNRYPFELLQNIRDAALSGEQTEHTGKAFFAVTETALIVANYGQPFTLESIHSIRSIGLSTKASEEFIGHKGIGFKSVFEITENPQIFSEKYQIHFSREQTVKRMREYALTLDETRRKRYLSQLKEFQRDISIMHVPHWMSLSDIDEDKDRELIEQLRNCDTIIRLPFRQNIKSAEVFKHLLAFPKEALLFLGCLKQVVMKNVVTNQTRVLTLHSEKTSPHVRLVTLQSNRASQTEKWLVFDATQSIPDEILTDEQRRFFSADALAEISIALPLDDTECIKPLSARHRIFYVYFPTQEPSPLPCLIHSFFQLKPARTHFYDCAFNEWLCTRVVEFLTQDVLEWVKNHEHLKTSLPELLIPTYVSSPAAELFRNKLLPALKKTAFVPTRDYQQFVTPESICLIPDALSEERVGVSASSLFSDESLSEYFRTACSFLPDSLQKNQNVTKLLRTFGAKEFTQEVLLSVVASEAERHRMEPHWFQQLYHFLRSAVYLLAQHSKRQAETFVSRLQQQSILLSANHQLYAPAGVVQMFLPPLQQQHALFAKIEFSHSAISNVPDALHVRFEFLHPEINVTETDSKGQKRLNGLGNFLVENGFVTAFQFASVLEEGILPVMENFDETFTEAEKLHILHYIKHLFDQQLISSSVLKQLPMGEIRVPVEHPQCSDETSSSASSPQKWMAAQDVYFPAVWSGEDTLEQLYKDVPDCYFLAAMDIKESERESWQRFFATIGVSQIPIIKRFSPSQDADDRAYQIVQADFSNLARNPLAQGSKLWKEYLSFLSALGEQEKQAVCWRIHKNARQTLEQIFALDKFETIIKSEHKRELLLLILAENWSFYNRFKTSTYRCSHLGCSRDTNIPSFFLFSLKHAAWIPTTLKTEVGKEEKCAKPSRESGDGKEGREERIIPNSEFRTPNSGERVFLPPEQVWVMSDTKEYPLANYLPFLSISFEAEQSWDKAFIRDLGFKSLNSATVADFAELLRFLEVAYPAQSLETSEKGKFKAFYQQILQHFNAAIQKERTTKKQANLSALRESPCRVLTERRGILEYINSAECFFADDKHLAQSLSRHINVFVCDEELPHLFETLSIKRLSEVVKQRPLFEERQQQQLKTSKDTDCIKATSDIKRIFHDHLASFCMLASLPRKNLLYRETNRALLAQVEFAVVEDLRIQTEIVVSIPNVPSIQPYVTSFFLSKQPRRPGQDSKNILYINAADAENAEIVASAFAHLFRVLWLLDAPHLDDAFLRVLRLSSKTQKEAYLAKKGISREELLAAENSLAAIIQPDGKAKINATEASVRADLVEKLSEETRKKQQPQDTPKAAPKPLTQQHIIDEIDEQIDLEKTFEIQKDGEFKEYQSGGIREPNAKYRADVQQSQQTAQKRTPYEMEAHQKLGETGEQYVFKKEKEYLTEAGREDLSATVAWVAQTDDTCGYDILSYYPDGREKYIEVKTTDKEDDLQFPMSYSEWMAAADPQMQSDYYIYRVVVDRASKSAHIITLKNPYQLWREKKLLIDFKEFYVILGK